MLHIHKLSSLSQIQIIIPFCWLEILRQYLIFKHLTHLLLCNILLCQEHLYRLKILIQHLQTQLRMFHFTHDIPQQETKINLMQVITLFPYHVNNIILLVVFQKLLISSVYVLIFYKMFIC